MIKARPQNLATVTATDKLCVGDTCVTPTQSQAMVAAASATTAGGGVAGAPAAPPAPPQADAGTSTSTTSATLIVNGNNPATLTVQCTPVSTYSCSGNIVVQTSTSSQCIVTTTNPYTTCAAPAFCSAGSAACLYPPPSPVPDVPNNLTGHLQARPTIVQKGKTTRIFWNISNVSGCTVTGTNGDSWSGATSGTSGKTSSAINQQTKYTLSCTALDSSTYQESTTVNLVPAYQER